MLIVMKENVTERNGVAGWQTVWFKNKNKARLQVLEWPLEAGS